MELLIYNLQGVDEQAWAWALAELVLTTTPKQPEPPLTARESDLLRTVQEWARTPKKELKRFKKAHESLLPNAAGSMFFGHQRVTQINRLYERTVRRQSVFHLSLERLYPHEAWIQLLTTAKWPMARVERNSHTAPSLLVALDYAMTINEAHELSLVDLIKASHHMGDFLRLLGGRFKHLQNPQLPITRQFRWNNPGCRGIFERVGGTHWDELTAILEKP